jgi:hypothetical protein
MTYGVYSTGPGLVRLKDITERLRYDDVAALVAKSEAPAT